jgi:hypothetical protein
MDSTGNTGPERRQFSVDSVNPDASFNVGNANHESLPLAPEVAPVGSVEQLSNPETQTGPGSSVQQAAQQVQDATQALQQIVPAVAPLQAATATTTPAVAADEDLIEKEWVDQIKKVVSTTKDNPHEQAKQVAELMRDYVRKRYGKEVGKAPEDI